jgi:hypothetical protein
MSASGRKRNQQRVRSTVVRAKTCRDFAPGVSDAHTRARASLSLWGLSVDREQLPCVQCWFPDSAKLLSQVMIQAPPRALLAGRRTRTRPLCCKSWRARLRATAKLNHHWRIRPGLRSNVVEWAWGPSSIAARWLSSASLSPRKPKSGPRRSSSRASRRSE